MEIKNIEYFGIDWAIKAVAQSYSLDDLDKAKKAAYNLWNDKNLSTGEAKHLELISVYFEMRMPRYFWQEFDTYRVGITKYSESTMHTIMKKGLTLKDFHYCQDYNLLWKLQEIIEWIKAIKESVENNRIKKLIIKQLLPESFLQNRVIKTDVKTLMYIIRQRREHELPEWQYFCNVFEKLIKEIKREM